jgi:hypothetical protein
MLALGCLLERLVLLHRHDVRPRLAGADEHDLVAGLPDSAKNPSSPELSERQHPRHCPKLTYANTYAGPALCQASRAATCATTANQVTPC